MESLVDAAWLQAHCNDPKLSILDCTVAFELDDEGKLSFYSGFADWQKTHIPGSAFADILGALSNTDSPHQFTLPSAEQFAQAMAALGVGDDSTVVLYDANFGMWATRVWWMLQAFGFENAAVLNGGFTAWQATGGEVSDVSPSIAPAKFTAQLREGWFVDQFDVLAALDSPACIIDALMPDMYNGTHSPYSRAGHLPGAINVPAVGVVDQDTRLFLDDTSLRELFSDALSDDKPVITYCGGGIAATADAFLLKRLGKQNVAVYDGSMAEWSADPALPLIVGEQAR